MVFRSLGGSRAAKAKFANEGSRVKMRRLGPERDNGPSGPFTTEMGSCRGLHPDRSRCRLGAAGRVSPGLVPHNLSIASSRGAWRTKR